MSELAAILDPPAPPTREDESCALAPYGYPEFSGPGGNRYLKKLLRQILPMALYRTWEIFADHQARGNDCYLSTPQLAQLAGRSLRTMQKNIASLQAKKLLIERAERKTFRGADGRITSRMVIVKDFRFLYSLAHEYHLWLQSEEMIPPERAYASLLSQDSVLVAKLRRFDNYRRLLYNHPPGSGRVEQEEDRWFTEYQSGIKAEDLPRCQPVQAPLSDRSSSFSSQLATKRPSKEASKETPKRISESLQKNDLRGDSFDSASPSSVSPSSRRSSLGNTQERESRSEPQQKPEIQRYLTQSEQEPTRSRSLVVDEREETSQAVQAAREAMARMEQSNARRQLPDQTSGRLVTSPQPSDHQLVRSFLHEIAAPFGDRNPKGTATRILNILAQASLEEAEVFLCLVRAYTIARDTRTIRSTHSDPRTGRANRMPLFCTLFERFVQARLHNKKWTYSWQQLEDDLAADDRLSFWCSVHQAPLAPPMPDSSEHQIPEDEREEDPPPIVGWVRREAAHYWGEQLLEALITAGYEAEVRVHLEKQWYQLILVGDGDEWVLNTPLMVQEVIEMIKTQIPNEITNI